MNRLEADLIPQKQDLEYLNVFKPNLTTIRELKSNGTVGKESPLWWDTDYEPDPREYLDFKEFKRRLVHLGKCKTRNHFQLSTSFTERDIYLYPRPKIPISILNLEISGHMLPFMVTARPYHEKELFSEPISLFLLQNKDLNKLKEELAIDKNKIVDLHQHFQPHVRGLFAGAKGNHFFWYPVHFNAAFDAAEVGIKFQEAQEMLKKKRLGFIGLYQPPYGNRRTYHRVWKELAHSALVSMNPKWPDFSSFREVSADEFIDDLNMDGDRYVFYPLRTPLLKETLPLVITTQTHEASNDRKPAVLGIYAENLPPGYGFKAGILRIKDLKFAQFISNQVSQELTTPIDTVLFTPQKGRPKYDRISAV